MGKFGRELKIKGIVTLFHGRIDSLPLQPTKIPPSQKSPQYRKIPPHIVIQTKFWYISRSPKPQIGNSMKHSLILISFLLLPISVYGFDWTVQYDMKKSDGSYEFVELSVPFDRNFLVSWELPNQVGSWKCYLSRYDSKQFTYSNMSLDCISKENENIHLQSTIGCNTRGRENNELDIHYPKTIKDDKSVPYPNTIIVLKCEV